MAGLLDPIELGTLKLKNRVWMAPLTRLRGTVDHIPTPIMAEYYSQRAGAGLIVSEGIPIAPEGVGYAQVPGLWSEQQTEAWKPVTEAVHQAGGHIFAQLWHVGRISSPAFLNGRTPLAPSALRPAGHVSLLRPQEEFVTPRAMGIADIKQVIEAFWIGAQNAKKAGFDGVELHGANGYLLDQFLQSGTNTRTDLYGGDREGRARFMLEATDAVIEVWGADRVGMHLAPRGDAHDIHDANPAETFEYVATELGRRKLAFLMAREYEGVDSLGPQMKKAFGGVYVMNERFTRETGNRAIADGVCDAVAFGQLFIANPDLPARFAANAPLNEPVMAGFYSHGAEGYTDYPAMDGKG